VDLKLDLGMFKGQASDGMIMSSWGSGAIGSPSFDRAPPRLPRY